MNMLKVAKQLLLLKSGRCPLKSSIRHKPYPSTFIHFLQNMPQMQVTNLSNGLMIATEERESCNACVGIFVAAGPRYENDFENGITHFFEHIAFKSTTARSKKMLENLMSCTGARYKCFTTRGMAAYYAECLSQDIPFSVDILSDCIFNNAFSETEIEEQKRVVYAEMLEHDRDSDGLLDDYLHKAAFQGTPLANTIFGPSTNLHNFNSKTIPTFMNRLYASNRIVLVAVGGAKHEEMVCLANTYFSNLEPAKCKDSEVYRYSGSDMRYRNDSMPVASCALAVEGPSMCDDDSVVMQIAAYMVGGWDKSQPGGEDLGCPVAKANSTDHICDAYKAFNISYNDTGLWGVKFLGPSLALDDFVYVIQNQWMTMCHMVETPEVERAKTILKTKMLSQNESLTATCLDIGKWMLFQGCRAPLYARLSLIDQVTARDVRDTCTRYLYDKCPVVAGIGPTCGLTDYTRIRASMYWIRF